MRQRGGSWHRASAEANDAHAASRGRSGPQGVSRAGDSPARGGGGKFRRPVLPHLRRCGAARCGKWGADRCRTTTPYWVWGAARHGELGLERGAAKLRLHVDYYSHWPARRLSRISSKLTAMHTKTLSMLLTRLAKRGGLTCQRWRP